jgi:hypothetical protein
MSFPTIPDINPTIDLNIDEVINLLLASVAFEELGLSHVINAEAEIVQFVLGTLPGQTAPAAPTFDNLIDIDRSVVKTLQTVLKNQMLLQFKLEDIIDFLRRINIHVNTAIVTATFNGVTVTAKDSAYYYTEGGT